MEAVDQPSLTHDLTMRAIALHDDVQRDPSATCAAARDILDSHPRAGDGHARTIVRWAMGRSLFELGDLEGARRELLTAVTRAVHQRDPVLAGRIRMSLAIVQAESGNSSEAMTTLRRAERVLPPDEKCRLRSQRTLVLFHRGDLDAAEREATAGLDEVRQLGDRVGVLRQLVNRSIVFLNAGKLDAATADLTAARPLANALDQKLIAAGIEHNLAVAAARAGDIPRALRQFATASEFYDRSGVPTRAVLVHQTDRAEALLHAGLADEAASAAASALALATRCRHEVGRAEALLLQARALWLGGDVRAGNIARTAEASFRSAGRAPWGLIAAALAWEIDAWVGRVEYDSARKLAADLASAGWHWEADRIRALVACAQLTNGVAVHDVPELTIRRGSHVAAPLALRTTWRLVDSLAARQSGDTSAARRIIELGLREIDASRATYWASDLRAGASLMGRPLADLGVRIAFEEGDPSRVLVAVERWRASGIGLDPRRAEHDAELAARLDHLRSAQAALAKIDPQQPAYRRATAAVLRSERAVRELAGATTTARVPFSRRSTLRALQRALTDRILVEFAEIGDNLFAITVNNAGVRLALLAESATVRRAVANLATALRRATSMASPRAHEHVQVSAAELDAMLDPCLGHDLHGPLVLSPSTCLHGLPWGALPSLRRRAFTVAPSAALWMAADERRSTVAYPAPLLAVAGPDLPAAGAEIHAIIQTTGAGCELAGPRATVRNVLAALPGYATAHIAAHGRFRSDNPQLSHLQLADGDVLVYDLERLDRLPSTVVLSACSAARSGRVGADDPLGTVGTLLARGASSVIAPLDAVADAPCAVLMPYLHGALVGGHTPGDALRTMREQAEQDPALLVASMSFVAFGA